MAIYGYARVSTPKQSLERQIRNIKNANPNVCRIFQDTYTGKKMASRPEFQKLCKQVKVGDVIIFDSVSRMSRDAEEGIKQYFAWYDAGIDLVFLNEPAISTMTYKKSLELQISNEGMDPILNPLFDGLNAFFRELAKRQIESSFGQASKEVDDLRERTRQGLKTAKINGVVLGRRPGTKVEPKGKADKLKAIRKLSKSFNGPLKDTELMSMLGISRNTYYKYKAEVTKIYQEEQNTMECSCTDENSKSNQLKLKIKVKRT